MQRNSTLVLQVLALALVVSTTGADEIDRQLQAILQAGPEGAGSAAARAASERLSRDNPAVLPRLLAAMDTPNPVAANWYRTAYEAILARELEQAAPQFPLDDIKSFVTDPQHASRVRRLALALCDRVQPGYANSLIPTLLDDPEFRGDAVDAALVAGQQGLAGGDSETAREKFELAFDHARASEQVVRAADKLAALGDQVDIAAHLGLVVDWWIVGPFDAPEFTGFDRAFPPEDRLDLAAKYSGQEGREIGWLRHRTADPLGLVNLVQALAPAKEAVGYAFAELDAPRAAAGQLRCGADDNCTVWLNGQKVFARQQWLNGIRLDRFVTPVQLRQGKNQVLVKICQGPQHKDPQVPNNWSLQLRFCDPSGRGLGLRTVLPESTEASQP